VGAVYVTLGLGAVFDGSVAVVRDLLRRGACRNPVKAIPEDKMKVMRRMGDLALGGAVKHSRYAGH
jgi:hypothetical protein